MKSISRYVFLLLGALAWSSFADTNPAAKVETAVKNMPFRVNGPGLNDLASKRAAEKHRKEVLQRVSYVLDGMPSTPPAGSDEEQPSTAQ